NHPAAKTGETYWYELWPQVLFDCLADRYPKIERLTQAMRLSSDRWNSAYQALSKTPDGLSFNHTAFNFETMKPVDNGKWHEPDAAAAIAWIQYVSYRKFGDTKYLTAADGCMKTLASAASLVPMVRYDERFARAIGKWMLNASNTVRLCYPDEMPDDMQSSPGFKSDPPNVIAYEGLRRERNGKRPYATGDPIANKWGPCDLGVYGSAFVGIYGGIILPTDDPKIPQLDLLATDFFRGDAYPSFLLYNPYDAPRSVTIKVAPGLHDLYDAVANDFVARGAQESARITIAPDSACVI